MARKKITKTRSKANPKARRDSTATKLVLCLMVRNEGKIIERCLRAALPAVDAVVLSVNNTTDDTLAVARRVRDELDVPGAIVESAWRNFGWNRTKSVTDTRAWVVSQGWDPNQTYALLIDADHVLHVRDTFTRTALTGPHYEIETNDGRLRNPGTRLVRLSHEWRCIGVTHEYWASEPNTVGEPFDGLWIEDRFDGGSKADKLTRDVALLKEGLKAEPKNGRYMFYLAESYFHLNQWQNAIKWYEKRVEAGGWDEEVWYAGYKRGVALLRKGETEKGAGALMAAFEARPSRGEPLAALAQHYRERAKNQLAYMLAMRGSEIPPSGDKLFVELDTPRRYIEEIAITGFYCGPKAKEVGFNACEALLAEHGKPYEHYEHWARNESFYLEPAFSLRHGTFPVPEALLTHDGISYLPANPTIIVGRTFGVHIVHVRLVNYRQSRGRSYEAPGGIFRTRGAVLWWDAEKAEVLTEATEVTQYIPADWPTDVAITGLEDQRWVWHKGRVWFTATCCQVPGSGGQPLVVLGLMNYALDAVERVMKLDYGGPVEKNWVPWSVDGELLLIYSYEPFVVLSVDTETGTCREKQRWMPPKRFARFRGGSSPVRVGDCWVMLVHEVARRESENIYAHRWVLISDKLEIIAYSKPFAFDHLGIEYAAGLVALPASDHDTHLIVTYGYEDKEARWMEFSVNAIRWTGR